MGAGQSRAVNRQPTEEPEDRPRSSPQRASPSDEFIVERDSSGNAVAIQYRTPSPGQPLHWNDTPPVTTEWDLPDVHGYRELAVGRTSTPQQRQSNDDDLLDYEYYEEEELRRQAAGLGEPQANDDAELPDYEEDETQAQAPRPQESQSNNDAALPDYEDEPGPAHTALELALQARVAALEAQLAGYNRTTVEWHERRLVLVAQNLEFLQRILAEREPSPHFGRPLGPRYHGRPLHRPAQQPPEARPVTPVVQQLAGRSSVAPSPARRSPAQRTPVVIQEPGSSGRSIPSPAQRTPVMKQEPSSSPPSGRAPAQRPPVSVSVGSSSAPSPVGLGIGVWGGRRRPRRTMQTSRRGGRTWGLAGPRVPLEPPRPRGHGTAAPQGIAAIWPRTQTPPRRVPAASVRSSPVLTRGSARRRGVEVADVWENSPLRRAQNAGIDKKRRK